MQNIGDSIEASLHGDSFYQLLVRNLPNMAILVFDKDLRYLAAEGQFLETLGLAPEAVIGKTFTEVDSAEGVPTLLPHYQSALQGLESEVVAHRGPFVHLSHFTPVRDDHGAIVAGMVISQNITAQGKAELALAESEARYRLLANNSLEVVILQDSNYQWTYVSPACERILGYAPEELIGINGLDISHPDDHDKIRKSRAVSLDSLNTRYPIVVRFRHKQGHYIWVEMTGQAVYSDQSHEVVGFVSSLRDVTVRHQTEEALRAAENRFHMLFQESLDGIILSSHGQLVIANPAAYQMFGWEPSDYQEIDLGSIMDRSDPRYATYISERNLTGKSSVELTGIRRDGTTFPVAVTSSFFPGPNAIRHTWSIVHDMTEHKRLQQTLIDQEKTRTALTKENELSALKAQMMQRMTHEFRTPLSVLQASIETLTTYLDRLSPEQRWVKAENIKRGIRRLTGMLDEISFVVRDEPLDSQPRTKVDLYELCQQVVSEIESQTKQAYRFVLDLPDPKTSTESMLIGDPDTLKMALTHVMRNAVRFSAPAEPVTICLSGSDQEIVMQVIDQGIGIPLPEQSRLFEPFFRASNINEIGGLGLGLTIAKSCIETHQGTIAIVSVPERGTTVTIRLPKA